jgi:hypothetical protein
LSPHTLKRLRPGWRTPSSLPLLRVFGAGLLAFLLVRPLFGLLHALLVVGLADLLERLTEAPFWADLVRRAPLDPVYTLALIQFAGEIQARGVAVAAPLGSLLHSLSPGLFAEPDLAGGAWASAVLEPGATVVARGLASFGANLALLAAGLALCLIGLASRRPWLAVCGALQQVQVLFHHFLDDRLSLRDLEAAGLPFALSTLLSDPNQRAPWFTSRLAELPAPLVSVLGGLLLAGLAYLLAGPLLLGALAVWAALDRLRGRPVHSPWAARSGLPAGPLAALGCGVLLAGLSPLGALAQGETRLLDGPSVQVASFTHQPPAAAPGSASEPPEPASAPPGGPNEPHSPSPAPPAGAGPVRVGFIGQRYRFALLVDGVPTVVRGMGYNAEYRDLPTEERSRRYDRDFALMRRLGVNVIFGWFQRQFDQVTLDAAQRHGLGVGLPFELNQDLEYADPALRARLTAEALAYVARYREHPAVWFWTPGNEVIHRLIFPSWLQHQRDPTREARADAFAQYYRELIDQMHALDPHHPIIYRDAEEVYLARIRDSLLRDGQHRPWFAYGTNVYTGRLAEILAGWPSQGLDAPLLVAEFSPGGVGPAERPGGLQAMWQTIRSYPDWVIGGVPYTWTSDGPEELDRVFGLVDGEGAARDGSLAAIGEMYAQDRAGRP